MMLLKLARAARFVQGSLIRTIGRLQVNTDTSPLRGTMATAAGWLRASDQGAVVNITPDDPVHVPPANPGCGNIPHALAVSEKLVFPSLYAAALPDARLLAGEGFVIVDGRLVLDMSPQYGRDKHDHSALLRWRLPPSERLDTRALVLTGIAPHNHYHWLIEILPRFEVARLSGLEWDHVIAPTLSPVQKTCLQRLGVDTKSILSPPWDRQLRVKEAVLSTFSSPLYAPSPFAVRFLRTLFADCLEHDAKLPRRIFVSRKQGGARCITNQVELESLLQARGFKIIELEKLGIEDQARLFANSELIVAPHGAGLTNAVFCRPGARLIELFGSRYAPVHYRNLAAVCGLDYYCMVDGVRPHGGTSGHYASRNMTVDVARLSDLI